jgi:hypothetical protein
MTARILAVALLVSVISSPVVAQGGAGGGAGGSSSGASGGAPGSQPGGTAGVSPSTSIPSVGTPGVPGPTNGAGLPGGPGPGNPIAPNQPASSPPPAAGGRSSNDAGVGSAITTTNPPGQGGGAPANSKSPTNAMSTDMQGTSAAAAEFHPEAVIDKSLDQASAEITAMSPAELRRLVAMFDQCTFKQHPAERAGKCAAARKQYTSEFGKNRAVDRALAELDRVVRFQRMFRTANVTSTEYEDNINNRLRGAARLALNSTDQTAQVSLKPRGAR